MRTKKHTDKNLSLNRKSIFFLCFEPREYRLTRVPCWCKRFNNTVDYLKAYREVGEIEY